jgi:uncharacterized caspase-like protein
LRIAALIGWVALSLLISDPSAHADPRVALVIGNGAYQHAPHLPNPLNDAADMSAALRRLGFTVNTLTNVKFDEMRRGLIEFGRQARGAELAIVFFAGHGIQMAGDNWLIPTDAQLASDLDVANEAIGLQAMVRAVSNTSKLGLVILDACRNNPFLPGMQMTNVARAVDRGLSRIEPSDNVLVAYAARDGTTARDGAGRNSPFTASLLKNIEMPGLEVRFLFANVRDDVMAATNREQQPFVYGSLSKEQICLGGCARAAEPAISQTKPESAEASAAADMRRDYEFALQLGTSDAWSAFLKQYPNGFYAELARGHLGKIASAKPAPAETVKPVEAEPVRPDKAPPNVVALATAAEEAARKNTEAQFFLLKVCNKSHRRASVAVMGRTASDGDEWHVQGWWNVAPRQCSNLKRYAKGKIYLFAQEDGNPSVTWEGDALRACVASPGPFDRVNRDDYKCAANERLVSFLSFSASDESFVWNLSPLGR